MAMDEDLAARMRVAVAGAGEVREVKMFGGLCFMLNGNMVAGTTKRGLLVRVGKGRQVDALTRPGAKRMEMTGGRWRATSLSIRRLLMSKHCGTGLISLWPS